MFLVGAILGTVIATRVTDSRWTPIHAREVQQLAQSQGAVEEWKSKATSRKAALDRLSGRMTRLQGQIAREIGDIDHPHFTLWNACEQDTKAGCALTPGHEYIAGVPDTFTYHVAFRSTVPVTVWIMSAPNFVCWETSNCAWHARGWEDRTRLTNGIFHEAEGCAGYIAVFFSDQAGILFPDVTITRNPADRVTGACRTG